MHPEFYAIVVFYCTMIKLLQIKFKVQYVFIDSDRLACADWRPADVCSTGRIASKGQDLKKERFHPVTSHTVDFDVAGSFALASGFWVHAADTYALDLVIKAAQPRRLIKASAVARHFEAGAAPSLSLKHREPPELPTKLSSVIIILVMQHIIPVSSASPCVSPHIPITKIEKDPTKYNLPRFQSGLRIFYPRFLKTLTFLHALFLQNPACIIVPVSGSFLAGCESPVALQHRGVMLIWCLYMRQAKSEHNPSLCVCEKEMVSLLLCLLLPLVF